MDATKPQRGGAGRGQGRKPLPAADRTVPVTLRMTELQRDKLKTLGGAPWVREKIDQAEPPKE